MKSVAAVARWIFGSFYAFTGASWFAHRLMGKPWVTPEETEAAGALTAALSASGIVDPLIAATCLVGGALLLVRRTAPLGVVVLAPLVGGIFLFHLLLNQSWVWGTLHLGVLLALAWLHRSAYAPLWRYGLPPAGAPRPGPFRGRREVEP